MTRKRTKKEKVKYVALSPPYNGEKEDKECHIKSGFVPGTTIRKPSVKLVGENGNAFFVLGKVRRALKEVGVPKEVLEEFYKKATEADYNTLLAVAMEYTEVE